MGTSQVFLLTSVSGPKSILKHHHLLAAKRPTAKSVRFAAPLGEYVSANFTKEEKKRHLSKLPGYQLSKWSTKFERRRRVNQYVKREKLIKCRRFSSLLQDQQTEAVTEKVKGFNTETELNEYIIKLRAKVQMELTYAPAFFMQIHPFDDQFIYYHNIVGQETSGVPKHEIKGNRCFLVKQKVVKKIPLPFHYEYQLWSFRKECFRTWYAQQVKLFEPKNPNLRTEFIVQNLKEWKAWKWGVEDPFSYFPLTLELDDEDNEMSYYGCDYEELDDSEDENEQDGDIGYLGFEEEQEGNEHSGDGDGTKDYVRESDYIFIDLLELELYLTGMQKRGDDRGFGRNSDDMNGIEF